MIASSYTITGQVEEPMRFEGKVALITGSGRGIGKGIAVRLASEGADVVLNFFRNRNSAEATAEEIRALGRRALVVKANIGELKELDHLFDRTEKEFGGLDFFVSNAASGANKPALEQRPKAWEWTMNINARPLLFGAQHAARLMEPRGGGRIISITSEGSQRVIPGYVITGASKAAIETLTRYLAVELAPLGISVNAVSPGIVLTDALQHFDMTPARRLVTPEDVASLVAFLCSDEAFMIRGQVIGVDGGFSLPGANVIGGIEES
jgi:enoyl-[acyl-carrier protein] reductase III